MAQTHERICRTCERTEEFAGRLDVCGICQRFFCSECAQRAGYGRKFCSMECARAYYFAGDSDDDEDSQSDD